jgi:hypothetical protein
MEDYCNLQDKINRVSSEHLLYNFMPKKSQEQRKVESRICFPRKCKDDKMGEEAVCNINITHLSHQCIFSSVQITISLSRATKRLYCL